jgi:hypothetical protein
MTCSGNGEMKKMTMRQSCEVYFLDYTVFIVVDPTVKQFIYFVSVVEDSGSSDLKIEKRFCETRRVIRLLN